MEVVVHRAEDWAANAAGRLRTLLEEEPESRLCLPTGETPRSLYASYSEDSNLDRATILLLDEFVLPEDDPGRCDAMIQRDLLDLVPTGPANLETWSTSGDLDAECRRFDELVHTVGLRLAMVGLGVNGHIGINEPPASRSSACHVAQLASSTAQGSLTYGARTKPTHGVTMGIGTLLEAEEIWLIVTGQHKRQILAEALNGPITDHVPASLLRQHPRFVVLADDAAAPLR